MLPVLADPRLNGVVGIETTNGKGASMSNRGYVNYINLDTRALTRARQGLDLGQFDLTPQQREGRVEAYRRQVETAGQIVQWLPPPAEGCQRHRRRGPVRFGRQWRWFQAGRLEGSTWSPAFVRGG